MCSLVQSEYAKVVTLNPAKWHTKLGSEDHNAVMMEFMTMLNRDQNPRLLVVAVNGNPETECYFAIPVSLQAFGRAHELDYLKQVEVRKDLAELVEEGVLNPPEICIVLE